MPLDIEYVPPPSIGHEIGVMFGFLGLMAVSMGIYLVGWQHSVIRGQRKEAERIEALRASGFLRPRGEEPEEEREKRSSAGREEARDDRGEDVPM